jgi:multiple sugar transport system ATP-binding protein/alpha-glucoside transport system ATP-binding protein|tara:strand:+ start:150 stop:1181 length:1032 start_codon:yes stop_codon:yes gene_type:complete
MADVNLKSVKKTYDKTEVIHGVDLDINSGEFIVFVGPSGCGKSTLLRMIAGLEDITEGEISIGGEVVNEIIAAERGVAMVFQSYALYPHMTVFNNMAFALKQAKTPVDEINRRVLEAAKILQIESLFERLPKQLSGGQRQRVAIGRAIVRNPKVFLFDEPLSNLDAALRVQTRIEIAKLHSQLTATMIYVTHDQVEAMTLADRIVVINQGVIEQVGTPIELYNSPKNQFVAEFIGSPKMNMINIQNGEKFDLINLNPPSEASKIGIRPEHLSLANSGSHKLKGTVRHIENLGEHLLCYINLEKDNEITAKLDVNSDIKINEKINLNWHQDHQHFFDSSGLSIF